MAQITPENEFLTDLFRRKNLAVVPKDQDELLQRPDAWAVDMKKTSYGLVNVPSHVLEAVKAAHLASKHGENPPGEATSSKGASEGAVPKSPVASPSAMPRAESPGTDISWEESPEYPPRAQLEMSAQSVVHETPNTQKLEAPRFNRRKERLQEAAVYEPPSSNEVEELETHLPDAEVNARNNSTTSTHKLDDSSEEDEYSEDEDGERQSDVENRDSTPPCAQPDEQIIPGTVTVESTEAATAHNQRRQRRMKPISFSDNSPIRPHAAHASAAAPRMQPLRRFDIETRDSSIPSSIIPATARESLTQASVAQLEEAATQNIQATRHSMSPEDSSNEDEGEDEVEEDGMEEEVEEEQQQQQEDDEDDADEDDADEDDADEDDDEESEEAYVTPDNEPDPMVTDLPTTTAPTDPYKRFEETYPDYKTAHGGNMGKFIKACVCLEYLQRERALREYLCDEFIRSFSSGYLAYVAKAGRGQEPLPAIEWFNIQRGPVLYGKMVVTWDSLKSVLEVHQAEVSRVRSLILDSAEPDDSYVDDSTANNSLPARGSEPMDVDEPEPAAQATPAPPTPQPESALRPATQAAPGMSPPPVATPVFHKPLAATKQKQPSPPIATPVTRTSLPGRIQKPSSPPLATPIWRNSLPGSAQRPSPHARRLLSPHLGSESPASTAGPAPVASQYMQQLAARRSLSNPVAEEERSAKLLDFLRKRKSDSLGAAR